MKMTFQRAFRIMAWAGIGLFPACGEKQASSGDAGRPSIIFIMSDDHANRTISAYGDSINSTPNIDRIANEGALFRNSFCGNSICGPSRASILTGKHSHLNGVTKNSSPWDSTQMVFPRLLQDAGYQTALIGKWHLNNLPGDEYDHYKILTGAGGRGYAGGQGFYYNPEFYSVDKGTETMQGYSTDVVTNEALKWLKGSRDPEKPFMLMVQYKTPHVPRMPALRFLEKYINDTIPEPATFRDDLSTRSYYAKQVNFFINNYRPLPAYGTYDPKKENIYLARMSDEQLKAYHTVIDPQNEEFRKMKKQGLLDDPAEMKKYAYQRFIKDYLRCVDALDENIGRLLDWLDENEGLKNNTIVVYTSDQSYFTGEHGYAEKRLMYEEALKMPLAIRWPGKIEERTRVNELVQNIDYAPTFLDMAGVEIPESMQGRSFRPVLEGKTPPDWRDAVYYHYYEHGGHKVGRHEGIRSDRYKLIRFYTDDVWEFYDLRKDPGEVRNMYDDPEYQDIIAEMKEKLTGLRTRYEVPGQVFSPPYKLK